jgi:single-strand DNA-binding protein
MAGVNRVILVGNLGKDPEIRTLEGGAKVANFPLATSETFKNKNGDKTEHTEWHNIVLWRGLAEIAEKFLKKGKTIYIEGRLRTRSWDDSTGNKRYITEVIGDNMTMLGGRKEEGTDTSNGGGKESEPLLPDPADITNDTADDLPF